ACGRGGAAALVRPPGRAFPELFLASARGGEAPTAHPQRMALRSARELHPLLRRIMQIHVTEEARHLCFARHYLREHGERLGPFGRIGLALGAPLILSIMAPLMMRPSRQIVRTYGIPSAVMREAYTDSPVHRRRTLEALGKVRDLCIELGLVTSLSRRLWQVLGLWEPVRLGLAA